MLIQAGTRVTAALLTSLAPQSVIKGADETTVSNTSLHNDNALLLPLIASATYIFALYLDFESATTGSGGAGDIKWGWSVPSGTKMRYTVMNKTTGGVADDGLTWDETGVPTAGGRGAGVLAGVKLEGTVMAGATAGTLQFRWAQNTSNGTATIVHAQSSLELRRST